MKADPIIAPWINNDTADEVEEYIPILPSFGQSTGCILFWKSG